MWDPGGYIAVEVVPETGGRAAPALQSCTAVIQLSVSGIRKKRIHAWSPRIGRVGLWAIFRGEQDNTGHKWSHSCHANLVRRRWKADKEGGCEARRSMALMRSPTGTPGCEQKRWIAEQARRWPPEWLADSDRRLDTTGRENELERPFRPRGWQRGLSSSASDFLFIGKPEFVADYL